MYFHELEPAVERGHAVVLGVEKFATGLAGVGVNDAVGARPNFADCLELGEGCAVKPAPTPMKFFEDDGHVVALYGVVGPYFGKAVFP